MNVRRVVMLLTIGAIALTAVSPEAGAGGGTPITSCGQTVTTNAFLTKDLYCPGSHGVIVGADGITIDLKGFTLRGDRKGGMYGIDDVDGFDEVTIRNGAVRNFDVGVWMDAGADGTGVSSLIASGNLGRGIWIVGDSARIESSTASGNGGNGIRIVGASSETRSSTASGNGNIGISIVLGDSAKIQSSTASGNASYGIAVFGGSVTIQSSTASGNGDDGIHVEGNSTNVKSSTAAGNVLNGIEVQGNGTTIQSSTASGNGSEGIYAYGDATIVNRNRATANGFHAGVSDLFEVGINATGWSSTPPVGTNTALGNDHPQECFPDTLC